MTYRAVAVGQLVFEKIIYLTRPCFNMSAFR